MFDTSKKTILGFYSALFVGMFSIILFDVNLFQGNLAPVLLMLPIISFSEFYKVKRNLYLITGNILLCFYFVMNQGSPFQYLFLFLIEILVLISIYDTETRKLKTKIILQKLIFRLIIISGLFAVSFITLSSELKIFKIPLLIVLTIQYLYSSKDDFPYSEFIKEGLNTFYFKFIKTILIPFTLIFSLKTVGDEVSFLYVGTLKEVYYLLGLLLILIFIWRKITTENIENKSEIDKNLTMAPFIIYYLVSDSAEINVLVCVAITFYIMYENLLISENKYEYKIFKNMFYLTPMNPLFFWLIYSITESKVDIYGKVIIVLLILTSWINFYLKSDLNTEKNTKNSFKFYLIFLLFTSVVYLYEKI